MNQFVCNTIDWQESDENLTLIFVIPEAKEAMRKLLDGATQLDLSFAGGYDENLGSTISFILRNGNGEIGIQLLKSHWEGLLDEPDKLILDYGDRFDMDFLPRMFLKFIDQQIERANEGEEDPFLKDILDVFAEVEE